MTNKLIILSALTALFLFSQIVSADLIVPGTKYISWCYKISNLKDYSDYVFVYHGRITKPEIIKQDGCFNFYKFGQPSIYAVKKSEFNESELNKKVLNENTSNFIASGLQLNAFGPVPENDPLHNVVVDLNIISLTENNLEIQKSKVTYTYTDGASEEKVFQEQNITPEPSRTAILPWWIAKFWYVILPIAAIVLIGIILLSRRLKR